MLYLNALTVGFGAAVGGILRYLISAKYNASLSLMPLGTLIANLIGAYLIGFLLAWLLELPNISNYVKLFLVTGFLGALTTFSTFSFEVVDMFRNGLLVNALITIFVHLFGSLLLTLAGIYSWYLVKAYFL